MATLRFRHNSAITVGAVIVMIAMLSLWTWAPYLLVLLVIPLAVALWSWRAGTDADRDGVTVRAALGRRRFAWAQISRLVSTEQGRVVAELTDGKSIGLPAVSRQDLPRLVAASGHEVEREG